MHDWQRLLARKEVAYWEYRQENVEAQSIQAWNKEIKDISAYQGWGHSLRLIVNKRWVFCYADDPDPYALAKRALALAKSTAHSALVPDGKTTRSKPVSGSFASPMRKDFRDVSLEEKRDLLLSITKEARAHKRIASMQASYSQSFRVKRFQNSDGSDITQTIPSVKVYFSATAKSGNRIEEYFRSQGGQGGYELVKGSQEIARSCAQDAIGLLAAKGIKGGKYPVVCDGVLTSVFCHEAVGHASEADHVESRYSCLIGKQGKRIAPSIVSMYDDPTLPGEWGSYAYDDEGIPAQRTTLIDKGIMRSWMHSRETAAQMRQKPTGNARAQSAKHVPQVRMSNTVLGFGEHDKEELFEGIKDGVYLIGSKGGQVDPITGTFQFNAQRGYMIRNGKQSDPVRSVSLTGETLKTLHNIVKISNTFETDFPGMCGKGGQDVPVLGKCPSMLLRHATIGGL